MQSVVLIGAGKQGCEHLKGIMKADMDLEISVIDTSDHALENAYAVYKQVPTDRIRKLNRYHSLRDLDQSIDLVIIATHADARKGIIEQLFKQVTVQYFLLEPVCFQSAEDYAAVYQQIKRFNCKAWVNCFRRYDPLYLELKKFFRPEDPMTAKVHGGTWGVGSYQSIQFMDLFSMFSERVDWNISTAGLGRTPEYHTRGGRMAFQGHLIGHQGEERELTLMDYAGDAPYIIQLENQNYHFEIDESTSKIHWSHAGNQFEKEIYNHPSTIGVMATDLIVKEILTRGSCLLPSVDSLYNAHEALLGSLTSYLEECFKKKFPYCPIT